MTKDINDYEEIRDFWDIDELHKVIHQFKIDNPDKKGYAVFNGHKFFTDDEDLTVDRMYKEITGMLREERIALRSQQIHECANRKNKEQHFIAEKISSFIFSGISCLERKHWKAWIDIVPVRVMDLYHGYDLECFLELYDELEFCTFEEAKETFYKQGHSGMSGSIVLSMLKEFSPKGEEFYQFMEKR